MSTDYILFSQLQMGRGGGWVETTGNQTIALYICLNNNVGYGSRNVRNHVFSISLL